MKKRMLFVGIIALMLANLLSVNALGKEQLNNASKITNNINAQNYNLWSKPICSTLVYDKDSYLRIECIDSGEGKEVLIERFTDGFERIDEITLPLELPLYGGIFIGTDYNYVVSGQRNLEEDDTVEVIRVTQYNKYWEKTNSVGLFGGNITEPFAYSTVRMCEHSGMLYVHTGRDMYTCADGNRHQASASLLIDTAEMKLTDHSIYVESGEFAYASHSFNQFIVTDGDDLLAVDQGDGFPRTVRIYRQRGIAGEKTFFESEEQLDVFSFPGLAGDARTGASLGGFEVTSSHYTIAGNSIEPRKNADLDCEYRNIFIITVDKNNYTEDGTQLHWLTHYKPEEQIEVSTPHLVKVNDNRLCVLWTENEMLCYGFLNQSGELLGEICRTRGALSDCKPILTEQGIVWYVTDQSSLSFYCLEIEVPFAVTSVKAHGYSYTLTKEPTEENCGVVTGVCDHCNLTNVVEIPAVSEEDYRMNIHSYATCTEYGWNYYTLRKNEFGDIWFYIAQSPLGHDWVMVGDYLSPTCTKSGGQNAICSRCGAEEYQIEEKLNHELGMWVQMKSPGCTITGEEIRDCIRCNYCESRVIEANGHTVVVDEAVAASCTVAGLTAGEKCSACGEVLTAQKEIPAVGHKEQTVKGKTATCTEVGLTDGSRCSVCDEVLKAQEELPMKGHSFKDGKCTVCGGKDPDYVETTPVVDNPFKDVVETDWYFAPVIWAKTNGVTGGKTANTFAPDDSCTRAQVVTFLWAANGKPEPRSLSNPFYDVSYDAWYLKPVLWAVEQGITGGIAEGIFGPDQTCTRAQIVTFLYAAAGKPVVGGGSPFGDVAESAWYLKPVLWAAQNDVTGGIGHGKFGPETTCTRAQVVTFLYKVYRNK